MDKKIQKIIFQDILDSILIFFPSRYEFAVFQDSN